MPNSEGTLVRPSCWQVPSGAGSLVSSAGGRIGSTVEFITGPLLEAPHRVGKPLRDTLSGFHSARLSIQWRVLYRIDESKHAVIVQDIPHRSTAYRRR